MLSRRQCVIHSHAQQRIINSVAPYVGGKDLVLLVQDLVDFPAPPISISSVQVVFVVGEGVGSRELGKGFPLQLDHDGSDLLFMLAGENDPAADVVEVRVVIPGGVVELDADGHGF